MSSLKKKDKREQSRDLVSKILMNLFHMRLSVSLSNMPSSLKLSNFPSTVITEDAGHFIAGTSLSLMWSRWQHVRRLWWKCSHQGCNSNSFEITWISDKSFWTDLWANVTLCSFIPPNHEALRRSPSLWRLVPLFLAINVIDIPNCLWLQECLHTVLFDFFCPIIKSLAAMTV